MSDDDNILKLPGAKLKQKPKPKAKVLPLGCVTLLDLDPDQVLENNKGRFEGFIFAGYEKDGEIVCGSTYADGGMSLWLLEIYKRRLMSGNM